MAKRSEIQCEVVSLSFLEDALSSKSDIYVVSNY